MRPPLEGHTDPIYAVTFSPDGMYIASGSSDKTIRLWDGETGETVHMPLKRHPEHIYACRFPPDGKRIMSDSCDNPIGLLDADTSGAPLEGYTGAVYAVAFSPDGKHIASGSSDETIGIWDIATGETVCAPLEGHTSTIWTIAFSPDGKRIVSGSHDGTVRVWNVARECTDEAHTVPIAFSSNPRHALFDAHTFFERTMDLGDCKDMDVRVEDGWIVGPASRLLLWLPHESRRQLYMPANTLVLGTHVTELDLSQFVHGPLWQQCKSFIE